MLLEIRNLKTVFSSDDGLVNAVDGVNLFVEKGETVSIVGGSGSGKTILSLSILGLVPEPGKIISGEIIYNGADLTKISEAELRKIRGGKISMIFQEPMTSLNPVYTIGSQIEESVKLHSGLKKDSDVRKKVLELLDMVGIPDPSARIKSYPFELSGGMRQRIMIAMALAGNPDILIADEPTTALDVTIQAQVLDLIDDLKKRLQMSVMLITHDFGIVAQVADRVYVMHDGKIVEEGNVETIFSSPKDLYTKELLASVPVL